MLKSVLCNTKSSLLLLMESSLPIRLRDLQWKALQTRTSMVKDHRSSKLRMEQRSVLEKWADNTWIGSSKRDSMRHLISQIVKCKRSQLSSGSSMKTTSPRSDRMAEERTSSVRKMNSSSNWSAKRRDMQICSMTKVCDFQKKSKPSISKFVSSW